MWSKWSKIKIKVFFVSSQELKGRRDDGEIGIFPANFVEEIGEAYEAVFDYESDVDGDLSFAAGEMITVTDKSKSEEENFKLL